MQMPHQGGLQHSQIIVPVPGVGKRRLARWGGVAGDLVIEAFDEFLLESGQPPYQAGPSSQLYQMCGFCDLCSVVKNQSAGIVCISPVGALPLVRGTEGRIT